MSNLMAYIPVVNRRHLTWLEKYASVATQLFLISQEMAAELVPRLVRNIGAVETELTAKMLRAVGVMSYISIFDVGLIADGESPYRWLYKDWVMPDEDVSHAFAEKYFTPVGCTVQFENIWARYDMRAVQAMEPVIADVELSTSEFDRGVMRRLKGEATRSPDWWRQTAALAVSAQGEVIALAHNRHVPTEYQTDILGDPRINNDAGQPGKYCSIHAEQAVIAECARQGLATEGGFLYATTFPCDTCAYAIATAGFSKVFFREGYSSISASREALRVAGVQVVRVV